MMDMMETWIIWLSGFSIGFAVCFATVLCVI